MNPAPTSIHNEKLYHCKVVFVFLARLNAHCIRLHYMTLHYITLGWLRIKLKYEYLEAHDMSLPCATVHHIPLHTITYYYMHAWMGGWVHG